MPGSSDLSSASDTDSNDESENKMMVIDEDYDDGNPQRVDHLLKLKSKSSNFEMNKTTNKKSPTNQCKKSSAKGNFFFVFSVIWKFGSLNSCNFPWLLIFVTLNSLF